MHLQKCLLAAAVAFMPLSLQAQYDNCCYFEQECCEQTSCCGCGYDYAINPPILPATECGKFYAEGTYLLWRAHCDNLTPGWVNVASSVSDTDTRTNYSKTNERRFSHDWDSGFRVGVGYDFPCDKWGVRANYTYYRTTANDLVNFENEFGGETVTSFLPYPVQTSQVSGNALLSSLSVGSEWRAELHQVDLEFTREYMVGCSVTLRPILGLRYICLDQKMNIHNEGIILDDSGDELGPTTLLSNNKTRYYAGGIKAGLFSTYEVGCGLGIYGDATISLVYGEYSIKEVSNIQSIETGFFDPTTTFLNTCADCCFCSVKPIIDYAIGLYWRKGFNCDKSLFEVRAGWEHHVYFSQNQFRGDVPITGGDSLTRSADGGQTVVRPGDLSFSGLAVTASILF